MHPEFNRNQFERVLQLHEQSRGVQSAGRGDLLLGLAELEATNYPRSLTFFEQAILKDTELLPAWLGKSMADAFGSSAENIQVGGAVFCLRQVLVLAPKIRTDSCHFFIESVMRHYVDLLCDAAVRAEAMATQNTETAIMAQQTANLASTSMAIAGLTTLFAKKTSTKILAGAATVGAFAWATSESERAELLAKAASGMKTLSKVHLLLCRDILLVSMELAEECGIPASSLDVQMRKFTITCKTVLLEDVKAIEAVLLQISADFRANILYGLDKAKTLDVTYCEWSKVIEFIMFCRALFKEPLQCPAFHHIATYSDQLAEAVGQSPTSERRPKSSKPLSIPYWGSNRIGCLFGGLLAIATGWWIRRWSDPRDVEPFCSLLMVGGLGVLGFALLARKPFEMAERQKRLRFEMAEREKRLRTDRITKLASLDDRTRRYCSPKAWASLISGEIGSRTRTA